MNDRLRDNYEALLLAYVAGALDAAQSLIVAAHAALSVTARSRIAQLEALGGTLLCQGCEPQGMSAGALDKVLAKLEGCCEDEHAQHCCHSFPDNIKLPRTLNRTIHDTIGTPQWQNYLPGFQVFDLPLECPQSQVRFLKAEPGRQAPAHVHDGMEITLLLDGAYGDENGHYGCGDLIVMDQADGAHAPVACREQGCICMVVSSKIGNTDLPS